MDFSFAKAAPLVAVALISQLALAGCSDSPTPVEITQTDSIEMTQSGSLDKFITAKDIEGLGTVSDESDVKFGSNELLFPNGSDGCNERVASIASGILDSTSVVVKVDGEDDSLVVQQAGRFSDESGPGELFDAVSSNASKGLCDSRNELFSEIIYTNEPLTGLPNGARGYTWLSEFYQEIALSCEGTDALVVRKQFWFISNGPDFYVTAVEWSGCEGSEGIQNPVGWDQLLGSGEEAHQLQLVAISG